MLQDINIGVFREAIVIRREVLGISRVELSEESGVSESTIKRFEHTGRITLENYMRIAKVLGVEINVYYSGSK